MGWIAGALFAGAFLFFSGAQINTFVLERGPTTLSCPEFLQRGASVKWVSLYDCALDWEHAREFQATRYRRALYVPVRQGEPTGHHLFIRFEHTRPDEIERNRRVWQGMLDTTSTDS